MKRETERERDRDREDRERQRAVDVMLNPRCTVAIDQFDHLF